MSRIWHKIVAAPLVAILLLVVLGALSYGVMARQHASLDDMYNRRFGSYRVAAEASQAVSEVHSNAYRLFTQVGTVPPERIARIASDQRARLDAAAARVAKFATTAADPQERKLADTVVQGLAKYSRDFAAAIGAITVDVNTGMAGMQAADADSQAVLRDLQELVWMEEARAQDNYQAAQYAFDVVVQLFVAVLVLSLLVAGAVTFVMSRAIVVPLQSAMLAARRIARGDLATDVRVIGRGETGELLQAMAGMQHDLRALVGEVAAGARTVADTSAQIAQGNLDLSQRTEEQASTLEETASAIEELTSSVAQNADNARAASERAVNAADVARRGGEVVGQVVATMNNISASSGRIGEIIGVIDGIAFQTNILALNAAVEAARAGEQGRGFAVVAAEVRSLAQRSARAAKEIKGLIGESVDQVQAGAKLVDGAGRTMQDIVDSVKEVSDLLAEIAAATREQSDGIGQVNTAVAQMDRVVQQNASLVEEAAAATESMRQQAEALLQRVSQFQVEGEAAAPAAAAAVPAPIRVRPGAPRAVAGTPLPAIEGWREF